MITRKIKGLLFGRAIKKSGQIYPLNDVTFEESFDENDGLFAFWYKDKEGDLHMMLYEESI